MDLHKGKGPVDEADASHGLLGLVGRPWLALGASVSGFGPLLGPLAAIANNLPAKSRWSWDF